MGIQLVDSANAKLFPKVADRKESRRYSARDLTYSDTFPNPIMRKTIAAMEWLTGKLTIVRAVRRFEKKGVFEDHRFFPEALDCLGIHLKTPEEQLDKIPTTGPLVVVANHPHGLIDGMVISDLIGKRRTDYRVLTRSLLVGLDAAAGNYMISVPFPHDEDAQAKGLEMRAKAMAHLKKDGAVAVFPSGVVASSDTAFGPAIEREWNVFTAKMIFRSNATVLPVKFNGQNSRWYQIANQISATLRQGLLVHEIAAQKNTPQAPTIGDPITPDEWAKWKSDPRGFMSHLHSLTMGLKPNPTR